MRRALALVTMCLVLLQGCTAAFFQPMRQMMMTPARIGLEYQDVWFPSADGTRLHAWYLPAQGESKGTLLFLHGNAENISTHIASVYWLPPRGYGVLLLDYRGYGESGGSQSLPGALQDAEAALGWLAARPEVRAHGMVVLGQSLGASLAVYVVAHSAYRDRIRGLVVDSAFSSYRRIAREVLDRWWVTWAVQWPLSFTVTDRYSPLDNIASVSPIPLLIMHSEHDQVIPVSHARALYAAARPPKTLWLVPEGGHIQALIKEDNRRRLTDWLAPRFMP